MKSSVHSSGSWNLLTLSLALLFALPFFSLIVTAGSGGENVWEHLLSTVLPGYLKNTFWLMLGVGSGTLLLGVSTGWLISMTEFPGRRMMEWALLLPLAFPGYIIAMVYVELLEFSGPVQEQLRLWFGWQNYMDYWFPPIASLGGAITMLSLVLFPYVYLLARTAFLQQSATLMEASRMLDKSAGNSFFMIALPLARPAIVVGVSLAMMETLADFALIWNILLVLAVLASLQATLTLPGIAGLILTVGMSIDANVIIFERIREELRKGKTPKTAIDSGYDRALTTIIDANVTTLIASLVLYQFGTGPIKGFATVLFWGILISMFTAVFITRTIFSAYVSRKTLTSLSI